MRMAIAIYEGFDELDVIGPYEVFKKAAEEGADLAVELWSIHGTNRVKASHGLTVESDRQNLDYLPDFLVVPGGGWNNRADTGAWALTEDIEFMERLRRFQEQGTTVIGVCTGGMVLARAGILDGRPATTHRGALTELRDSDAEVVEKRVVDDGDVLTAGGVTSGIDLALHVVEREFGAELAKKVSERIEFNPRGSVHQA